MTHQLYTSNQHRLSRQFLTRVGVTLIITGFLILSLNYFSQLTNLKHQIRNQAQSITESLALTATEIIASENTHQLTPILQKLSQLPAVIQVSIVTPQAQIIASSISDQIQQEESFWSTKMQAHIKKSSQTQTAIYFSEQISNKSIFTYLYPIKFRESPSQIIIVILETQSLQQKAWVTFLSSVLLLLLECLIVLILIGLLLRQTVLAPLNQLYLSLSQYQIETTLDIPKQLPINEIGLLAKAIYQQFIDLKQINAQLKIEVAERKKAENKIQSSLQEKELLLREIHHRVKNNLFIVSQMLELQTDYLEDLRLNKAMRECQDRIHSMALIHETLYQTTNLKDINFADYLKSLIGYLNHSYSSDLDSTIKIQLELQPVILNIETANPCGLIINELVVNAFKHAFKTRKTGIIRVTLTQDDVSQIRLQIQDNGIGFPESLDFQQVDTLGLELVRTLTQQLQGHLELDRRHGTLFTLTFTELNYNKHW